MERGTIMNKKIIQLISALGMSIIFSSAVYADVTKTPTATANPTYLQYQAPEKFIQLYETNVNIDFLGQRKGMIQCYFYNNRLCVPLRLSVDALGGTLETDSEKGEFIISINNKTATFPIAPAEGNRVTTLYVDGTGYIYLYDLLNAFDMTPTFDIDHNSVTIYRKQLTMPVDLLQTSGEVAKPAYLRLEDIMADGLDYSGRKYSDRNLEKLMTLGEYLNLRGQEYYIAWIPYYQNPAYEVYNELTDNTNLYNACFMYTLDFLVGHGGHIGVHGYTHQYGNAKSSDGWEWGKNTPFSVEEQQRRLIMARQTAERFGFKVEFFEFPHYGATVQQLEMAERYYDVIYQSHPDVAKAYTISERVTNGKKTWYIPTPADYVHSAFDGDGIVKRFAQSRENNWTVSLFYHPALDFNAITYTNDGYDRSWNIPSTAIITRVVNDIVEHGEEFKKFDPANHQ